VAPTPPHTFDHSYDQPQSTYDAVWLRKRLEELRKRPPESLNEEQRGFVDKFLGGISTFVELTVDPDPLTDHLAPSDDAPPQPMFDPQPDTEQQRLNEQIDDVIDRIERDGAQPVPPRDPQPDAEQQRLDEQIDDIIERIDRDGAQPEPSRQPSWLLIGVGAAVATVVILTVVLLAAGVFGGGSGKQPSASEVIRNNTDVFSGDACLGSAVLHLRWVVQPPDAGAVAVVRESGPGLQATASYPIHADGSFG
jgi:hypothetical protein